MGKYERDITDKLERDITSIINGEKIESIDAEKIAKYIIGSNAKKIKEAIWNGYDYKIIGDITVFYEEGMCKKWEIKRTAGSKATRANIGQDSITGYGMIVNDSWSTYMKKMLHFEFIAETFNKYLIGKGEKERLFSTKTSLYEFAGIVKDKTDFAEYKTEIMNIAREEKLSYIKELMKGKQDSKAIKVFVFNMLKGNHSKNTFDKDILDKIHNEDYEVVYLINDVIREDILPLGLDDCSFSIKYIDDSTSVMIVGKNSVGIEYNILRIVFHWKNKFQGIQTPCLNIFDEF